MPDETIRNEVSIEVSQENPTIRYAAEELAKYLTQMCGVDCMVRLALDGGRETTPTFKLGLYLDLGIEALSEIGQGGETIKHFHY